MFWHIGFIVFSMAFLLVHWQGRGASNSQKVYAIAMIAFSLFLYVDFGKLHTVSKQHDPAYQYETGKQEKKLLLHWHETYHYYMGSKYFPELGYHGLYEATLLADYELFEDFDLIEQNIPFVSLTHVRDLTDVMETVPVAEALERAKQRYRPRFTNARWELFKKDWLTLKKLSNTSQQNHALFDAGFNPPPSWAVIGSTVSNLIPISKDWFDYPATLDQIEILAYFDVLLFGFASIFLFRAFGLGGLAAFWVIFSTSALSAYGWNTGSYFRFLWLFGLILGICQLKQREYFWAGLWLTFAACMRGFPAVFLVGAFIYLATHLST